MLEVRSRIEKPTENQILIQYNILSEKHKTKLTKKRKTNEKKEKLTKKRKNAINTFLECMKKYTVLT